MDVCRGVIVGSDRPFESNETERHDAHMRPVRRVDHLDTPNHHVRPQKFPTPHRRCIGHTRPVRRRAPHRPRGFLWGEDLWGVVGTRQPSRSTMGVTFDLPGSLVRFIWSDGRKQCEKLDDVFAAEGNGDRESQTDHDERSVVGTVLVWLNGGPHKGLGSGGVIMILVPAIFLLTCSRLTKRIMTRFSST